MAKLTREHTQVGIGNQFVLTQWAIKFPLLKPQNILVRHIKKKRKKTKNQNKNPQSPSKVIGFPNKAKE